MSSEWATGYNSYNAFLHFFQSVKYYTSMSLVFYSISRRASLRESKQNQQEVHDQEVEAEAEAEAVSKKIEQTPKRPETLLRRKTVTTQLTFKK